jgi:hypothetical protein
MSQAVLRGDKPDCSPIEVVLTIPRAALTNPTDDVENVGVFTDGTCVSAETARRLTCDCGVVELVEDEKGNPLSVGRKTRTMSASLRRALLRRDGCCRFPGCTNRVYLEGHHIEHWSAGGETSLENACLFCSRHHTFVHEHGYRVELVDGDVHIFDPHGRRVHQEAPRLPRSSVEAWQRIHAENTNQPGWNGLAVQYDLVVGGLGRLDGLHLTPPPKPGAPLSR